MKPMLGKAKWWEKKTVENAKFKSHYKAWCVIERVSGMRPTKDGLLFDIEYVAVGKCNVPQYYDPETMTFKQGIHVDNLTKEEAFAMAKMLNFVGKDEVID
ncbi:MAG: hypothetical protein EBW87_05565 [Burkholderiaceae bacterium]|nr:hypothetical protein [Burkholderiaceae bacterium]